MKVCSSTVEHLAHDGKVAGSNLAKPILILILEYNKNLAYVF